MANDTDDVNEASPLLPARSSEEIEPLSRLDNAFSPTESQSNWIADAPQHGREESRSSLYLFLLTLAMLGLSIAWSVELSNGSPYLLSLGISKSFLALVWIAGPLSGVLVQPYIGIKSDQCRSRFGKRRPFMIGGGIATVISLLMLAWARELVSGLLGIFGVSSDSKGVKTTTIVLAVLMIFVLDFAINAIQAAIRAFIVDNAPAHQQDSANAWAVRLGGAGSIIGYLFGYVELPEYLWFFGDTQVKILCMIASLATIVTIAISASSIRERDPRLEGDLGQGESGVFSLFHHLYRSIRKLPSQISKVCQVQFFAFIGWFPVLFYITTYVAEIYVGKYVAENPNMSSEEIEKAWQRGTRVGAFALFMFAFTKFMAIVVLPFIVARSYQSLEEPPRTPMTPTTPHASRPEGSRHFFAYPPGPAIDSRSAKSSLQSPRSIHRAMQYAISSLELRWLTLRRAWMLSHAFFALLTWLTFLVRTTTAATVLVALFGIPWAMTNWAPFALISAEISKRDAIRRGTLLPPPTTHSEDPSESADQAGVILGIHNVAIAAPQIIATLVSSAIFWALQKPRGSVGDDSVAWVLRFGGCAALVAACLTRRVGEEKM